MLDCSLSTLCTLCQSFEPTTFVSREERGGQILVGKWKTKKREKL